MLTFEDVVKMGWQRSYKLLHDIVKHDMNNQAEKQRQIINKKQFIKKAKENKK